MLILLRALVLGVLLAAAPARGDDTAGAMDLPGTPASSTFEANYYREMDRQTEAIIKRISEIDPNINEVFWRQVYKRAQAKIKGLNPLPHAKEVAHKYGATAGLAFIVGEAASWMMAPVFMYLGSPGLAALCTAPWGIPSVATVVYLKQAALRRQVARELGVKSVTDLNKLRREILGFEINQYLMSAVYEAIHQEKLYVLSLNVKKEPLYAKIFNQLRSAFVKIPPKPFVMDSVELIKLVKNSGPEGQSFLKNVEPMAKDMPLYTLLLLKYVNTHPDLQLRLLNSEMAKVSDVGAFENQAKTKSDLIRFKELEIELAFLREDLEKRLKAIKHDISILSREHEAERIIALQDLETTVTLRVEELKELQHQNLTREYSYLINEQARRSSEAPLMGENLVNADAHVEAMTTRIIEFRLVIDPLLKIAAEEFSKAVLKEEVAKGVNSEISKLSQTLRSRENSSIPGIIPEPGMCGQLKLELRNQTNI